MSSASDFLKWCSVFGITIGPGGNGDVVGPGVAVDGNIASFNGTTGKIIKDSGVNIAAGIISSSGLNIAGNQIGSALLNVHGQTWLGGNTTIIGQLAISGFLGTQAAVQFSSLTTGVLHADITGNISSSAVNLASADVTGVTPSANGGTGVNNGSFTSTLGGNLSTQGKLQLSGAFDTLLTITAGTALTLPTAGTLASTSYVDTQIATVAAGLVVKNAVYCATTVNIVGVYLNGSSGVGATFTVTATGVFTVDGATPPLNQFVLFKNQTSQFQNGIWKLTTLGSVGVSAIFTRATDYDTSPEINPGDLVIVDNGGQQLTSWVQTATVTTIGTDSISFSQFSYAPTDLLLKANNLSDLTNATTARTNLVLGTTSNVAFASVAASTTGGGNFAAFTSSSSTSPSASGGIAFYIRNSNSTANNWMSYAFLNNAGNLSGMLASQNIVNNGNADLVLFAASTGSGMVEGIRLVGSTNTVTLANALPATSGGTGVSSYATGDLLQASASTTLSRLASVATGNVLISGGVTTVSSWGKVGLTTHVSGTLGVGNGGSGTATAFTSTAMIYAGTSGIYTQDASFFAYDSSQHRLSIGTNTFLANVALHLFGISGVLNATMACNSDSVTSTASVRFLSAGAAKWEIGKSITGATNVFQIYDTVAGTVPLSITSGAGIVLNTPLIVTSGGTGSITGSITGTSALTFAAGGSNQAINLTPSGNGAINLNATSSAIVTIGGSILAPNNPRFLVTLLNSLTNKVGAGTRYTFVFDTLEYDASSNITLAGTTFTAGVTGKYYFYCGFDISSVTAAMTAINVRFAQAGSVTRNFYIVSGASPAAIRDNTNDSSFTGEICINLVAGDTVQLQIDVFNGAGATAGFVGGADPQCYWGGWLVG